MPIENVNTVNTTQVQKPDSANQTVQIQTATKPYPNDTVEINGKKKTGMSNGAKVGIGTVAFLGLGTLLYILTKGKTGSKQVKQLAEHIEFNETKSIEEATKFAKEHLGITKFDVGNNLEIANWVIGGLTRVSNRYKGKAPIPNIIETYPEKLYQKMIKEGKDVPMVDINKQKGRVRVNTHCFDDAKKNIQESMDVLGIKFEKTNVPGKVNIQYETLPFLDTEKQKSLISLLNKVINNKATSMELITCNLGLNNIINFKLWLYDQPELIYSRVLKSGKLQNIFSANKDLNVLTLDEFKTLTKEKQTDYLYKLHDEIVNGKTNSELLNLFSEIKIADRKPDPYHAIIHDMGHALHAESIGLNAFYKTHLLSDTEKDIAATISNYATTDSREFVAEVFAELIKENKLPDDVMALYKKYNGPTLPA